MMTDNHLNVEVDSGETTLKQVGRTMTTETVDQATEADTPVSPETGNVVYEEPSFDDLKWPPEPIYTYAQLYEKLVRQVSHEEAWGRVQRLLVFGTAFMLPINVFASPPGERWYQVWFSLTFVLMTLLVASIVFFAWSHNRSVANTAAATLARLIAATRSPRSGEQGLSPEELRRLRQVAEDEQAAADWRGGIVTTLIVTIVLTAVVVAFREVGPEFIGGAVTLVTGSGLPLVLAALMAFVWLMLFIGFAYIAFSLFRYYRRFISSELANRVILLATAEALTTLQDCGLSAAVTLAFEEKLTVIGCAGYQLSRERLSFSWTDDLPLSEFDLRPKHSADWFIEPLFPKQRLTLPEIPLAFFYILAACAIWMDNVAYGGLLTLRGKYRRRTYELFGRQELGQLPRFRKRA